MVELEIYCYIFIVNFIFNLNGFFELVIVVSYDVVRYLLLLLIEIVIVLVKIGVVIFRIYFIFFKK